MAADVIARLQLQGQQFSSESGRIWAQFEANAKGASRQAEGNFRTAFDQIKRIADEATSRPLNSAGAIDLNANEFREAAQASQLRAAALRDLEQALRATAAAEGEANDASRLAVQAAASAAASEEQRALNLNAQAAAFDRIQTELNQTTSATRAYAESNKSVVKSQGASSQAAIQASQQFQDFFVQVQGGQSVLTAFSQQGSQLAFVLSNAGGKVGKVASIFAGPWGTAIFAGTTLLTLLIPKVLEFSDSAEKQAKALESAAKSADSFGNAQSNLGKIIDLTTGALKTQNQVLIQTVKLQAQAALFAANKKIEDSGKDLGLSGGLTLKNPSLGVYGISGTSGDALDRAVGAAKDVANQQKVLDAAQKAIFNAVNNDALANSDPSKYSRNVGNILQVSISALDQVAIKGKLAGKSLTDAKLQLISLANTGTDKAAALQSIGVIAGGDVPDELTPYKRGKTKKPRDRSKEVASIEEFGRDTLDRLANLQAPFAGQPKMIDAAAKALREVADITDDLERKNTRLLKLTGKGLPGYALIKQQLADTAVIIREGLDKPYRDFMDSEREALQIQKLITEGRSFEAGVLQDVLRLQKQQGPLDAEHLQALIDIADQRRAEARAAQVTFERTQNYLGAVRDVRASVERVFETLPDQGVKSLGNFVKNLRGSFNVLVSKEITEKLFGNIFRDIEDKVSGASKVDRSADIISAALGRVATAADSVTASLNGLAGKPATSAETALGGGPVAITSIAASAAQIAKAANDNQGQGDDIVVTGRRRNAYATSPIEVFNTMGSQLISKIFGDKAGKIIGDKVGTALQGAFYGQTAASLVLGNKGSNTGAALGGAIGGVAGEALKGTITATLGKTLGNLAGPLGSIAGGLLGSVVGGLLKKTKTGVATLSIANGEVGVGSVGGNNAGLRSNATKLGGSVGDSLQSIAEALGGDLSGAISVSIGQRNKKFVVDPTGAGRTKGAGVLKFTDEQDAVQAAIRDALSDGVIGGISAASQRILASGQDLERAITKASLIEAIPKALKERLDPVGAAIDEVNEKWEKTVAALKEGGASAEQMAQAQQLYNLELDDAKNNTAGASSSLKEFVDSLKFGSSSPYSLRDQEASALSNLQPFLDKIAAGQAVDNDKYIQAAQSYLDIERQLKGSTDGYFAELDRIQAATAQAISTIDNATPIRTASDPFAEKTAANTQAAADILAQNTVLLQTIANLIANGSGGGASFGDGRLLTQQV